MLRGALAGLLLALPAHADLAVITSQGGGALSFVNTDTGQMLQSLALPGQPAALAVAKDRVAVMAVGTKTLHLLDFSGRELARRSFAGAPFGLAFDARSGDLLLTDAAGAGSLHRLSAQDLRSLEELPAAANPTGLDSDAAGHIVVAARDADLALIYRADCMVCAAQKVPVGHHPFGVTIHQGKAFVTNVLSDDVSVIDLGLGQEVARIPAGARPYAVAFAAGRGFVSNQYDASLTVFDARDFTVIATVETGDYPEGLSATTDGQLLVANWFSDNLQSFDAASLLLNWELEMPEGPRAFGRFTAPGPAP